MAKETAMEEIERVREEFNKKLGEMRAELDKALQMGKKLVEERPLMALGVAFALGLVVGLVLDKATSKGKD